MTMEALIMTDEVIDKIRPIGTEIMELMKTRGLSMKECLVLMWFLQTALQDSSGMKIRGAMLVPKEEV